MGYYAGLDWGGASHAVCIINDTGRVIEQFEVRHEAEGIAELTRRLSRVAPAAEMPGDCQEFRARLGMMGAKEPAHAETQTAAYS